MCDRSANDAKDEDEEEDEEEDEDEDVDGPCWAVPSSSAAMLMESARPSSKRRRMWESTDDSRGRAISGESSAVS